MTLDEREKITSLYETYQGLLTQTQKQVLHLLLMEDLSLGEIAEILATSRQAVNDAVQKGKKKLLKIQESVA